MIPSGDRVAIIGGGVSGALSAVRLAQRGFSVTLLEKAAIGNGSSSRSMAGIRAQFGARETIVGMLFAEWFYVHFHDLLETPPDQRQPVIRQNGYLFLYDDPDSADLDEGWGGARAAARAWEVGRKTAELQRSVGVPVEILDRGAVLERWPFMRADLIVGGTFCPTDGFLYPPVIYGEAIRRARELGVDVRQQTEVVGARSSRGRLTALVTARGDLTVDAVVNCTNAWSPRVSRLLGGMELAIEPTKRYLYHLKPDVPVLSAEALAGLPMTIFGMGNGLGAHYRPDGDKLILAGTGTSGTEPEFADEDQDVVRSGFGHTHGVDNLGIRILLSIERYAPELATSGGLVATTCGFYGLSPDGSPLIGRDSRMENLFHAAGFSGHGVMHAPITAFLVESLVAGDVREGKVTLPTPFQEQSLDLDAFDPSRDFARSDHEHAVL
ncbi:MAG: FAD-binding oxidoreductase [Chloroflexota bacterium]